MTLAGTANEDSIVEVLWFIYLSTGNMALLPCLERDSDWLYGGLKHSAGKEVREKSSEQVSRCNGTGQLGGLC